MSEELRPRDPHRLPQVADLALLVAVAEHGGVGAAARALTMAQPNASRALRRLEAQLRLTLLERTARGSKLTREGSLVVDWARRVLDANHRLLDGAAALRSDRVASIAVAASQTIAEDLLPRWLGALRQAQPDVVVDLAVGNSEEVGRRVNQPGVLGFVESPALPTSLIVEVESSVISSDRLVVVVAPGHGWARRTRPVPLAEFVATRLVVREPGSGTRVSLERALNPVPLAPPALELDGNTAVRVAVSAGVGPAVLSEHAVRAAVQSGELRAVMVEGLVIERPLRAIWARSTRLSATAERLIGLATSIEADRTSTSSSPPEIDPGWGL